MRAGAREDRALVELWLAREAATRGRPEDYASVQLKMQSIGQRARTRPNRHCPAMAFPWAATGLLAGEKRCHSDGFRRGQRSQLHLLQDS
jgi:hypothetical protein